MQPATSLSEAAVAETIASADALLVVTGTHASRDEGLDLFHSTPWFRHTFSDLIERHRLRNIAHGITFPYPSPTMEWAFMARLAQRACFDRKPSSAMRALASLALRKPTFLVTTGIGGFATAAEFNGQRVFEMMGNLRFMACHWQCNDRTVPSEEAIARMLEPGCLPMVPAHLLPRCPLCHGPMIATVARTHRFSQRQEWLMQAERLRTFLQIHEGERLLVAELGVAAGDLLLKGLATSIAEQSPRASYLMVSDRLSFVPIDLRERTLAAIGTARDGVALLWAAISGSRLPTTLEFSRPA